MISDAPAGHEPATPAAGDPPPASLARPPALRPRDRVAVICVSSPVGILFARGGSGAQRTLEAMDWAGLAGTGTLRLLDPPLRAAPG